MPRYYWILATDSIQVRFSVRPTRMSHTARPRLQVPRYPSRQGTNPRSTRSSSYQETCSYPALTGRCPYFDFFSSHSFTRCHRRGRSLRALRSMGHRHFHYLLRVGHADSERFSRAESKDHQFWTGFLLTCPTKSSPNSRYSRSEMLLGVSTILSSANHHHLSSTRAKAVGANV